MCPEEECVEASSGRWETCLRRRPNGKEKVVLLQSAQKKKIKKRTKRKLIPGELGNCCSPSWSIKAFIRTIFSLLIVVFSLSIIACIGLIYKYELHTPEGFSKFWFKWENIDIDVEQVSVLFTQNRT